MVFSSVWSLRNEWMNEWMNEFEWMNAFRMSIFNIMSCGRVLLINFRVVWTAASAPPATPKPTCTGRSCSETLARTDCTAFAVDTPERIIRGNMPNASVIFTKGCQRGGKQCTRDQYERFPFKIWFARRDIELRSRYSGSFVSMLARSRMWLGRIQFTPPLLHPAENLMAARTDSGVAHNGEHWSGKGTILVFTGVGGCLERSTAMTYGYC